MPITPPRLDDRNFEDLVDELLARVPAHTPEWVPQLGDPGRTLLELFAWLADTILYRANLIPERQRLAFLNLIGLKMRPAIAARGLVSLQFDESQPFESITLAKGAKVSGPVDFETLTEVTVLPIQGECFYKRPLTAEEEEELSDVLDGLREFHEIEGELTGYVTTPIFNGDQGTQTEIDLIQDTTDNRLWVALLAATPGLVDKVKKSLAGIDNKRQQILNVGIAPALEMPVEIDQMPIPGQIPHVWEITSVDEGSETEEDKLIYSMLTRLEDSSKELTRRGIERFILPGRVDDFGVPEGDVRKDANAGVGDRPPRLDDPEKLARLVAWLRLRPTEVLQSMALSWVGINAVEIDQRQTISGRIVGQSDGSADQQFQLPIRSVEAESFELQVEETGRGYVTWQQVADLAVTGPDHAVYDLDSEAGMVSFGNGITGRIPEAGRRIRIATMRAGGGRTGNLLPASLEKIDAFDLDGKIVKRKLKVIQSIATDGGEDPETLVEAEKRIPSWLQHRNRCVTAGDYRALAAETPGVRVGRIEVLPRFMPQQRRPNVPGVVSVMVLPYKELTEPPNPRPDRPYIEKVFTYLNERRPLATELYVIGCEYVPLGLGVGITVREGFGHDQVARDVRESVKRYLWCLPPDGPTGEGWPLGRKVNDREIEVAVARVNGVNTVGGINLFVRENKAWRMLQQTDSSRAVEILLEDWQLPELLSIVVTTNGTPPEDLRSLPDPFDGGDGGAGDGGGPGVTGGGVAVPVVPEVC